jgi:glycosyltransferase involved in cell wall biosynthesis
MTFRSPEAAASAPTGSSRRVLSVIVPVYNNETSLPDLLARLRGVCTKLPVECRIVFVVDGSPDRSAELLRSKLATFGICSRLVVLSRNFGSFAAIRAGLAHAQGDYFAVIAADLQEPPELLASFVEQLESGDFDLVLGERRQRDDPLASRASAGLFWWCYRTFVQSSMPRGGVDVFACNEAVRSTILSMREANTSLIGQLLWIGFRRTAVKYDRLARTAGKSGWTMRKKLRYMSDSIFSFTDLPIRLLLIIGLFGCLSTMVAAIAVFVAWVMGLIDVPGYTPLMLAVLGVGCLLTLALGVVGSYVWRSFENTKVRPLTIEFSVDDFPGGSGE